MILKFNASLLSGKELFTFSKNAQALIEAKKTQLPAIVPFLDNTSTRFDNFCSALEREARNPFIRVQTDHGNNLVKAFMSFRDFCKSASSRRKAGVAEAGQVLCEVIRKHGWNILMVGQKARTGIINTIISEIVNRYAAELAIVGGGELLDELSEAQIAFEAAAQQVIIHASENDEPTVGETRPLLIAALKAMFQYIALQEIALPSTEVTSLIATLNGLITSTFATVKAADTREENQKKEAEGKIPTDPATN